MQDLIEFRTTKPPMLRLAWGPDIVGPQSVTGLAERLGQFARLSSDPELHVLLDWWLAKAMAANGCPVNDRSWKVDLAAYARQIVFGERDAENGRMRYRYFGEELATRLGIDLGGKNLDEFSGRSIEDLARTWGPVFDEGRPIFIELAFGQLFGRSYVKTRAFGVPLADDQGVIRFALGVHHFEDVQS